MHVFFSGIGGAGIGPLAVIAKQAGYEVSGSDKQYSEYVSYLEKQGIDIYIGQTENNISQIHEKNPIDWLVYSSAVEKEHPTVQGTSLYSSHPEIQFAHENGVRLSKRDEFINEILDKTGQKMIAVAGTHGKTTTTAMVIWLFKQLNIPVSYSVGAKLSFGAMGEFDKNAEYFVYEADEYDRNFLNFSPVLSIIPGIDYDHPDVYPTRAEYYEAFQQFFSQSDATVLWETDATKLKILATDKTSILASNTDLKHIALPGHVNRLNAQAAVVGLEKLGLCSYEDGVSMINKFPGVSRRFERIAENIYSDYAHTPEKIRGAIQTALETSKSIVTIYEGLHNTRQHFIRNELSDLFEDVEKLYIVPSYLAREDESLELLTPEKLCEIIEKPTDCEPVKLDENLKDVITKHANQGDLVLCLSAGGGGSLDEWLRTKFKSENNIPKDLA